LVGERFARSLILLSFRPLALFGPKWPIDCLLGAHSIGTTTFVPAAPRRPGLEASLQPPE
jgi:hypothetical protein